MTTVNPIERSDPLVVTDGSRVSRGAAAELTEAECLSLMGTESIGRIAFVNAEGQQLVPVNFIVVDDLIYFRTSHDSLLSGFERGHDDVAFGIDHHDDSTRRGWNVTVHGHARQVEDRANINKILGDHRLAPWAGGVKPLVIEISPRCLAGRRVFQVNGSPQSAQGTGT